MVRLEKALYTARTHTTGGRDGASRSSDGRLDIQLSIARRGGNRHQSGAIVRGRLVCVFHRGAATRREPV